MAAQQSDLEQQNVGSDQRDRRVADLLCRYRIIRQNSSNLWPIRSDYEVDSSSRYRWFPAWLEDVRHWTDVDRVEFDDRYTRRRRRYVCI